MIESATFEMRTRTSNSKGEYFQLAVIGGS